MSTSIYNDLRKYRLICIVLCISMMPLIAHGYSMYVLILLFPYIFRIRCNANYLIVVFFSLFYTISFLLRGEELPISKVVFYSLFPIIVYSCGNFLATNLRSGKVLISVIVSLIFCLAAPGIYFSIVDVIKSGELIKISRAIEYTDGKTLSATAYGMMFSLAIAGFGMIMVPAISKFDRRLKSVLIVLSIFAIFCTIHIVNRTGIALCIISIVTTLLIPPYSRRRLKYTLLIFVLIAFLYSYFLYDSPFMNDAVQGYLAREKYSEYSAATGGGRFERWGDALTQIFSNPFGSFGYYMDGRFNYAHNLWLDAGLRGGIIPFLLLLIIEYDILKDTFRIIKRKVLNSFENIYLIVLCVVMFAQAMTEPVIEGVYQFFLFMMFFYGCVSASKYKNGFVEDYTAPNYYNN